MIIRRRKKHADILYRVLVQYRILNFVKVRTSRTKTNNNTAVAAAVPVVAVTWLTSRPPVIGVDGKEYAPGARLFATADRISQDVLILPKF